MDIKIQPELLQLYAFWSGVMVLKVLFVVLITAGYRFTKGVKNCYKIKKIVYFSQKKFFLIFIFFHYNIFVKCFHYKI